MQMIFKNLLETLRVENGLQDSLAVNLNYNDIVKKLCRLCITVERSCNRTTKIYDINGKTFAEKYVRTDIIGWPVHTNTCAVLEHSVSLQS